MKRHPDPRYYLCPKRPCMGQVAPVLQDDKKRIAFLCHDCGQSFSQTKIDQEYRLLKMRG